MPFYSFIVYSLGLSFVTLIMRVLCCRYRHSENAHDNSCKHVYYAVTNRRRPKPQILLSRKFSLVGLYHLLGLFSQQHKILTFNEGYRMKTCHLHFDVGFGDKFAFLCRAIFRLHVKKKPPDSRVTFQVSSTPRSKNTVTVEMYLVCNF